MTGALVLALPGVLCAVMAWDLSQPAPPAPLPSLSSTRSSSRPGLPGLRQRAAAGVLAACASTCLAAAVLLTVWAPPPVVFGAAGGSGALALVLAAAWAGRLSTSCTSGPRTAAQPRRLGRAPSAATNSSSYIRTEEPA